MNTLRELDPPLCCPTGVCKMSVNQKLVLLVTDLECLENQGVEVERCGLAHRISTFVRTPTVHHAINNYGSACLPLLLVDGQIVSMAEYPSRGELAVWTGIASTGATQHIGKAAEEV